MGRRYNRRTLNAENQGTPASTRSAGVVSVERSLSLARASKLRSPIAGTVAERCAAGAAGVAVKARSR